jgi:hypothetical protein
VVDHYASAARPPGHSDPDDPNEGHSAREEAIMAQDLASAIVDLGVSAEKRRHGRRALRESVDLVVGEILRHTRVGDEASIRFQPDAAEDRGYRTYKVERVDWLVDPPWDEPRDLVAGNHPEATLVQYTGCPHPEQSWVVDTTVSKIYHGAALLDVRHDIDFVEWDDPAGPDFIGKGRVTGREVHRVPLGHERETYQAELHLATDDELLTFAGEAYDVVHRLAKSLQSDQSAYATAAAKLSKLAPK